MIFNRIVYLGNASLNMIYKENLCTKSVKIGFDGYNCGILSGDEVLLVDHDGVSSSDEIKQLIKLVFICE